MEISKPVFISAILLGMMGTAVAYPFLLDIHVTNLPVDEQGNLKVKIVDDKQGFMNTPAYDSGWFSMQPSQPLILRHNLNTTEVFVYLIGKSELWGVHQNNFGGNSVEEQGWRGSEWHGLNATHITITRHRHDFNAEVQWNYVRVMIWKISD